MTQQVHNLLHHHPASGRRPVSLVLPMAFAAAVLFAGILGVLALGHYGAQYAVAATASFSLIGVTVMLAWRRHAAELPGFGIANSVTLLRGVLVALVAGALGQPDSAAGMWPIVGFAATALVLDGVDGWLARRRGNTSAFGARFDQETDALLILVLCLLVLQTGKAGVWVLAAGLMRYAFIGAAIRFPWLARPLPPSRRRQAVCVVQVAALILCLAPVVSPPPSTAIAAASVLLLAWSFAVDIIWLWNQPADEDGRASP